MTRRVFRYVPFTIEQDQTAEPEYEARCVSGDDAECGARSGTHGRPEGVEEWQRKHTQDTGHRRYRRNFGDYAVMRPAEERPPERGALVYDPGTRRVGEYQATVGPYALLRPVGGGREWEADPGRIRPATQAERLSAGVKAANSRAVRRP
ncbi:DUF7848 domain-containing protein [Wenjunlia vitaminophila]|nr:hypothetical protein [Wenjunlia vitaminophila]